jgi:hypothetical protein
MTPPFSVHLLCRPVFQAKGKHDRQGFRKIESHEGFIASHAWVVDKQDRTFSRVRALIGSWIYFHSTKATQSEFGGIVRDIVESETERDRYGNPRLIFIFEPNERAEGIAWRGGTEQRRVVGRFVPASLPHEADTGNRIPEAAQ